MSESTTPRRIRAQSSPGEPNLMGFVLDAPVQTGASPHAPSDDAPLGRAFRAVPGVTGFDVTGATIWMRKAPDAEWATLKPAIAAAIRQVLDETDTPLGAPGQAEPASPDETLLQAVQGLLASQVNPSVAAHGGHIDAEKVSDGIVYLRMSGGCQGCAASAATLRQGVERMLRAALPQIREIVDVTDHDAGNAPFYEREPGASAVLERGVPPGVITWEEGKVMVDPDFLAPRLGLSPDEMRAGLRSGDVVGVTETGVDEDAGKTRIVLRSPTRAWAAEIRADGSAREIPPPREVAAASQQESALAARVRAHLEARNASDPLVSYGALARALGLWMPGSVRKITRALEMTMQQDAGADRPFIAARAVGRGSGGLPGRGFFELARALSRGPRDGESDAAFHARELHEIARTLAGAEEAGPR